MSLGHKLAVDKRQADKRDRRDMRDRIGQCDPALQMMTLPIISLRETPTMREAVLVRIVAALESGDERVTRMMTLAAPCL